jgi:hypothetical protein
MMNSCATPSGLPATSELSKPSWKGDDIDGTPQQPHYTPARTRAISRVLRLLPVASTRVADYESRAWDPGWLCPHAGRRLAIAEQRRVVLKARTHRGRQGRLGARPILLDGSGFPGIQTTKRRRERSANLSGGTIW